MKSHFRVYDRQYKKRINYFFILKWSFYYWLPVKSLVVVFPCIFVGLEALNFLDFQSLVVPNSVFCGVLARLNFWGRILAVGAEIGTNSLSLFVFFVPERCVHDRTMMASSYPEP